MAKWTVVASYLDNNQILVHDVEAEDAAHAIAVLEGWVVDANGWEEDFRWPRVLIHALFEGEHKSLYDDYDEIVGTPLGKASQRYKRDMFKKGVKSGTVDASDL
jgi:hypothetical protein